MRINKSHTEHKDVYFHELKPGDVFTWGRSIFLKIVHTVGYNAVEIGNGVPLAFEINDKVALVDGEFVIGGTE